jgi:heat shock protein HtpX
MEGMSDMNRERLQRHHHANLLHSILLLGGMAGLAALAGWMLAGPTAMLWAGLLGLAASTIGPRLTPALVMRVTRAREIDPLERPALYSLARTLSERAGLPAVPRLYQLPLPALNAFTVGSRRDAVIALSDGLLALLDMRQVAGVLAHEISHLRHGDTWVLNLAATLGRLTALLSRVGVLLVVFLLPAVLLGLLDVAWGAVLLLFVAPMLVGLMQLALSRTREYEADRGAAELLGDPEPLISALARLEVAQAGGWEHLFATRRGLPLPESLLSHPPTARRIHRLRELSPGRDALALPALDLQPWLALRAR